MSSSNTHSDLRERLFAGLRAAGYESVFADQIAEQLVPYVIEWAVGPNGPVTAMADELHVRQMEFFHLRAAEVDAVDIYTTAERTLDGAQEIVRRISSDLIGGPQVILTEKVAQ